MRSSKGNGGVDMSQNEFTKKNAGNGISSQAVSAAGLNVFALTLLIESFTELMGGDTAAIEFPYKGVKVRLEIYGRQQNED